MESAYGVLGWTPEVFWNATPADYALAISGKIKAQGGGREHMSRNRLLDLIDEVENVNPRRVKG